MKNLEELQRIIWNQGFFVGVLSLEITLKSEFDGFYGKASEDWEKQVEIKISSKDSKLICNIKVTGKRGEGIDEVAAKVLEEIKKSHPKLKPTAEGVN